MVKSNCPLLTGARWCGGRRANGHWPCLLAGRDKGAEARVISVECSGVPPSLAPHGYGPVGRIARREAERWRTTGKGGVAQ